MKDETEKLIEAVIAAREIENERRIQGGRNQVSGTFVRIVEDYDPPHSFDDAFPSPLTSSVRGYETVRFGHKCYPLQQRDFLDALTAVARRDRRIAELEVELARERSYAADWRRMCLERGT